jgi:hypothetical protein
MLTKPKPTNLQLLLVTVLVKTMDLNVVLILPTHVATKESFADQVTTLQTTNPFLVKNPDVLTTLHLVAIFTKRLAETKMLNAVLDKLTKLQEPSVILAITEDLTVALIFKLLVTTKMLCADQVTTLQTTQENIVMDV